MNIFEKIAQLEHDADAFGFKWSDAQQILEQIQSECREVQQEVAAGNQDALQNELGDLIHATICLCLFCKFSPEETLKKSLEKLTKRYVEVVRLAKAAGYTDLNSASHEQLMHLWNQAKINTAK